MDPRRFDALARSLHASRRGTLGALVAGALAPLVPVSLIEAKKKHKKKKKCKCGARVCGPCVGKGKGQGKSCGTCAGGTNCNAQGQCVGCVDADQCAPQVCKQAACVAEVCQYDDLPDGTACQPSGNVCCGGACVDLQTDADNCDACGHACAPTGDSCSGGVCQCGGGPPCPPNATCESGQCVCPLGQVLCLNQCLNGACCAVGSGCFENEDCCLSGGNPGQNSCEDNVCCKNGGSSCGNSQECCSGFCDTNVTHQCA